VNAVATFGWATGGQWLAHYAATHPDGLSHLVLFNSIWPVHGAWPVGDALEDPERPGELKPGSLPGYGYATEDALLARWNDSIPVADIDHWRDPVIASTYARAAIEGDPASRQHDPPAIRTPLGAMADSFLLSTGHRLFDPDRITARVLVLRSALDFWSRPVDIIAPRLELTSAASVTCLELSGATHFAHLDRAEHGRAALLEAVLGFLRE
jgi:pimeloyl-ACP methyl ester carboxylesterase